MLLVDSPFYPSPNTLLYPLLRHWNTVECPSGIVFMGTKKSYSYGASVTVWRYNHLRSIVESSLIFLVHIDEGLIIMVSFELEVVVHVVAQCVTTGLYSPVHFQHTGRSERSKIKEGNLELEYHVRITLTMDRNAPLPLSNQWVMLAIFEITAHKWNYADGSTWNFQRETKLHNRMVTWRNSVSLEWKQREENEKKDK